MAGLESLDETQPTGNQSVADGDADIRETRQKTKESVNLEHTLEGYHTIPTGTVVTRPAPEASHGGRIYFLETSDSNEIQVWDGTQWVNYTRNVETETNTTDIADHIASNPVDHIDSSVTRDKLKSGLLAKKHFLDGSSDNGLVAELVNGASTTLHTHPAQAVNYPNSAIQFARYEVASGTSDEPGKVCPNSIANVLSSFNAKGVILEAYGVAAPNIQIDASELTPRIKIKASGQSDSEYMILLRSYLKYSNLYSGIDKLGWGGQGFYPINSSFKFDYLVKNFESWSITMVGYFV